MKKTRYYVSSTLILLALPTLVQATTLTVEQKDKQFVPVTLNIKVGDSVNFLNQDPFYHNVFSLSDTKSFDLGSFPKGQFKTVVFDKAGKVVVECAIHPNMHLEINVTK